VLFAVRWGGRDAVGDAFALDPSTAFTIGRVVAAVLGAAAVGFVARFHHPPDPLVHVLAFGGLLFAGRLLVAGVSRGRALAGRGAIRLPAGSAPR
jgi:hypothetical protein